MARRNSSAVYVEPAGAGGYTATWGNANKALKTTRTQQQAIDAAHKMAPEASVHVARVRDTKYGRRNQFRKAH